MISDKQLEYSPQWTPKAAQDIGGPVVNGKWVPPTKYTVTPATNADEWMHVDIEGPSWTCMLASLKRPLMPYYDPAAIYFTQAYDLMTDGNAPTAAQAIEVTDRVNIDGVDYLCGGQFNYAKGGMYQIYKPPLTLGGDAWADTGIVTGIFTPNTLYRVRVRHLINTVAKVWSVLSLEVNRVNRVLYQIPTSGQKLAGLPLSWPNGVYAQKQLDFNKAAGKFGVKFRRVSNRWE